MDIFSVIWNYQQQGAIDAQARQLASHQSDQLSTEARVSSLEERVSTLVLVCESLVEILQSKLSVPEAEIRSIVQARLDEASKPLGACSNCGHKLLHGKRACIYCGNPIPEVKSMLG